MVGYADNKYYTLPRLCTDSTKIATKAKSDSVIFNKGKELILEEVAVTATRTDKNTLDLPIPITIIDEKQIRQMGSMRLNEVLQEQTGLAIINDHGTGLQMQGFASDYTLILIDGEPIIGRTAGTLDLTRLAVGNIERIEIVKGPSSSLYGSEALAGVVNIITKKAKQDGYSGEIRSRYGSNNTLDINGTGTFKMGKLSLTAFANRYSTSGYSLRPETGLKTVSPFQNYAFNTRLAYQLLPKTEVYTTLRYFSEFGNSIFNLTDTGTNSIESLTNIADISEYNLKLGLIQKIGKADRLLVHAYTTRYDTRSLMVYNSDGSLYDFSFFTQNFTRPEVQYDRHWNEKNTTTFGTGVVFEDVQATRYDDKKYFRTYYGFLQHDIKLFNRLFIIAGARYDAHNVYGSRLSPKIAAQFKFLEQFRLKASFGQGFKAPDFRQIYLNFTNPSAGYSVFGTGNLMVAGKNTSVDKMISLAGGINAFSDFEDYKPLTPEALVAANPDVIVMFESGLKSMGGLDGIMQVQGMAQINAGKNKKVIEMDGQYLAGFGPRVGKAIVELSRKF